MKRVSKFWKTLLTQYLIVSALVIPLIIGFLYWWGAYYYSPFYINKNEQKRKPNQRIVGVHDSILKSQFQVRIDSALATGKKNSGKLTIQRIKISGYDICWNDIAPNTPIAVDSFTTPANIVEEYSIFGRALTDSERSIQRQKWGNLEFDTVSGVHPLPTNLNIANFYTTSFEITYGVEVDSPKQFEYQYIMEGLDNDWCPVTKKNTAIYSPILYFHNSKWLSPQKTFKVRARTINGAWCNPVSYELVFHYKDEYTYSYENYLDNFLVFCLITSGIISLVSIYKFSTKEKRRLKAIRKEVKKRTDELVSEKKKTEDLLLNILPMEISEELKQKGSIDAKQFEEVSVLFTDFLPLDRNAVLPTKALVNEVHQCFTAFDAIMEKHGLEKIKTIGDIYLAVCGLPDADPLHAQNTVKAALNMVEFIAQRKENGGLFDIVIGINSGPVVAGIVGVKKFAYDIWGDTVNTAARMEQNGEAGKVNISETTYELVKDDFFCEHRGKITAKNKGSIDMYFVEVGKQG